MVGIGRRSVLKGAGCAALTAATGIGANPAHAQQAVP